MTLKHETISASQFFDEILDLVRERFEGTPMAGMTASEVARGYVPVPVGSVPWLPLDDWHATDLVTLDGKEVRIVAIVANNPHTGAFKRLLAGIEAAGLSPVVIAALPELEAILRRWRWRKNARKEWRPDRPGEERPAGAIESEWQSFREASLSPNAGAVQSRESKRCFFAGAAAMMAILVANAERPDAENDDAVHAMEALNDELWQFGEDVAAGRA